MESAAANPPRVTVGLPVYNGASFLCETLDSILNQTFRDFEVVISDNASDDETPSICQEYAQHDSRIRVIRHSRNRGSTANFQFVLSEARGEYFIWVAADDLQEETLFETLFSVLQAHDEVVLVTSDILNVDRDGNQLSVDQLTSIRLDIALADAAANTRVFFRSLAGNVFFAIYGMYRTAVLREVELNYRNMVTYLSGSETPLLAQVSLRGRIVSVPGALKLYRRHEDSIYHQEAKGFRLRDQVLNKLNISHALARIAASSARSTPLKVALLTTIIGDLATMTCRHAVRLTAAKLSPRAATDPAT